MAFETRRPFETLRPFKTHPRWGWPARFMNFSVSETIDGERISASMKNGMLELTLPKTSEAEMRRIPVRAV